MLKNKLWRLSSELTRSKPLTSSNTAPVRFWYLAKASGAKRINVVPVEKWKKLISNKSSVTREMTCVHNSRCPSRQQGNVGVSKTAEELIKRGTKGVRTQCSYLRLCSNPQKVEAGGTSVVGMKVRSPTNFEESIPPKVTSPFTTKSGWVRGERETLVIFLLMIPCINISSLTVGMRVKGLFPVVLKVRSLGPIPRIPSTPNGYY